MASGCCVHSTAVANRHHPYVLLGKKVRSCPRFAKGIIWSRRQIWSWFTMSWLLGGICWLSGSLSPRIDAFPHSKLWPGQIVLFPRRLLGAVGGDRHPQAAPSRWKDLEKPAVLSPLSSVYSPLSSSWTLSPLRRCVPLVAERCLQGLCWGCWCASFQRLDTPM